MRIVGVNKNYQDEHNKSNDKYKLEVGLPSEVRCSAVDDIVVLLVHLQERAVLAAVLPELRIHPQTAIRHKTMQTPPPLASTIQLAPGIQCHNTKNQHRFGISRVRRAKP